VDDTDDPDLFTHQPRRLRRSNRQVVQDDVVVGAESGIKRADRWCRHPRPIASNSANRGAHAVSSTATVAAEERFAGQSARWSRYSRMGCESQEIPPGMVPVHEVSRGSRHPAPMRLTLVDGVLSRWHFSDDCIVVHRQFPQGDDIDIDAAG